MVTSGAVPRRQEVGRVVKVSRTADSKLDDAAELRGVLLATGLTLVSMILLPALAGRLGLGPSMTLALRGVFMRASGRV